MRKFLLAIVAVAGFAGCYVEDSYATGPAYVSAGYGAPAGYVDPEMVVVSPGVQVVYNYDYPVFFNAGFYWRYDGGVWYSSHYYNSGWARSYNVPVSVRGISHPEGYAHYQPAGYTPRGYNRGGGNVGVRQGYRAGNSYGGPTHNNPGNRAVTTHTATPTRSAAPRHR